jgi:hypothetical protein
VHDPEKGLAPATQVAYIGVMKQEGAMASKLSDAQARFLWVVQSEGSYRTPFTGGRNAGRVASAWYRTAKALAGLGLVRLEREGDAWRAFPAEEA